MINNIYISGLGAIGSAYAAKLYEMDPQCIKIIASRERIESYQKEGVRVNEKLYSFEYVIPAVVGTQTKVPDVQKADLIIVAVKYHHLQQAIKDISGFVGENTIILSLLNGITSEEIIGQEFGMDKLLYSFVVGTDAVRTGRNTVYENIGRIVFGEKNNKEYSHKVKLIKELFDAAKIPYEIPENMMKELWWKFMMNVGINQVSAVLNAPYGVFRDIREARELLEEASREVTRISCKVGIDLNEDDIKKSSAIVDSISPEGKTSMLQDVEAGRKTEVEMFAGTVVEMGKKYGIPTPVNEVLLKMIRVLEQKNKLHH